MQWGRKPAYAIEGMDANGCAIEVLITILVSKAANEESNKLNYFPFREFLIGIFSVDIDLE